MKEEEAMMRKLSSALSLDRPGSRSGTGTPRVHPGSDDMPGSSQGEEAGNGSASARGTGSPAVAAPVESQQQGGSRCQTPPAVPTAAAQPPVLSLLATSGGRAMPAGLPASDCVIEAETPINAHKQKAGLRISFADNPGNSGGSGSAEGSPTAGGLTGREGSFRKNLPPGARSPPRSRTSMLAISSSRRVSDDEHSVASDRKSSVFDMLERGKSVPRNRVSSRLARFLGSGAFLLVSLILTIMILYSDSLRIAATPKSADPYFLAFTILVMVFFALEIIATCIANPRYIKTFYCWVDIIATVSCLIDIPAILDPIVDSANDGNGDQQQRSGMENAAQITAASTRAARLAQVTKWMRLWRIIKLWAIYYKHKNEIIDRSTFMEDSLAASQQSRVGAKLTELTIRKVIVMVLLVMFAMPVFDVSVGYYGGATLLDNGGLSMLHSSYGALGDSSAFQAALQTYVDEAEYRLGRGYTGRLKHLTIFNQTFLDNGDVEGLRKSEYANFTIETPGCGDQMWPACAVSYATFDTKWDSQIQGLLEIGRTTFIIIILLLGACVFIKDTERLVLTPLERMVQLVKEVSENPLAKVSYNNINDKRGEKAMETQVLETSIHKICSLLSVGFGEAGAEVIADNIKSEGDLNPITPGRKVAAIFGFCDIRSFTDATEVLQEDVMEFVNTIAKIVHQEVSLHGGAANKNIGDAFLLVWKLAGSRRDGSRRTSALPRSRSSGSGVSRASATSGESGSIAPADRISVLIGSADDSKKDEPAVNIADQALASFICIQAAVKRSAKLREFCAREDLNRRMPGYQVSMGFGLHVGWAIEGAIGSEFKIDASYLSPHVNMASRLEAATKQFGTTILLSEDFVRMLSPAVRTLIRQVDCVTVKGSNKPIGLYTYDVDVRELASMPIAQLHKHAHAHAPKIPAALPVPGTATEVAEAAAAAEDGSGTAAAAAAGGPSSPKGQGKFSDAPYETFSTRKFEDEFSEHPDIIMTRAVDAYFLQKFNQGYAAYKEGRWDTARSILEETKKMRVDRLGQPMEDGPSATLLRYMSEFDFEAPAGWVGVRELTEK